MYLRMGRVVVWSRKEMYLIAGIAASVKVAKMVTGKNRTNYKRCKSDSVTNVAWSSLAAG